MSNIIKYAYEEGMRRALADAGLLKLANIDNVRRFIKEGLTPEEAWAKAYPGQALPENLEELLEEASEKVVELDEEDQ